MVKRLYLFFVGIFFVLVLSMGVSADWQQKVDWNGNAFDWALYGHYWWTGSGIYSPACNGSSDKDNQAQVPYSNYWFKYDCNRKGISSDYVWEFTSTTTSPTYFTCIDNDGDGYASNDNTHGVCSWASTHPGPRSLDCDDNNFGRYPGNAEISDGIDNNCNNQIDEGFACVSGDTKTCGTDVGECQTGTQTCTINGQWGSCIGSIGLTAETCDGKDNNCDGQTDEGWFHDGDGDGFGKNACNSLEPLKAVRNSDDCNDNNANIKPGAPEICDFMDNQCLGEIGYPDVDENPNKICSTAGNICILGTCKAPSTYWAENFDGTGKILTTKSFPDIQKVYLVLENFPIGVALWEFEIYEKDSSGGDDSIKTGNNKLIGVLQGDKIIAEWNIVQTDINNAQSDDADKIYDFYFTTKGFNKRGGEIGGILSGSWERTTYGVSGNGIFKGRIYLSPVSGTWDTAGWQITQGLQALPPDVWSGTWKSNLWNMGKPKGTWESSTGLWSGTWNTTIREDESIYDYTSPILKVEEVTGSQPPTSTCSDNTDCSPKEECVNNVCVTPTPLPKTCSQYNLCSDYLTNTDCAENSCQLNSQTPTLTCPSDAICGCSWNSVTNSCGSSFSLINSTTQEPIGTCTFQETEISNCETSNFLEYETTAAWDGDPLIAEKNNCISGKFGPIFCSAKTSLPLENKFGILLTIISIIGIYFIFFRRNKILK